MPPTKKKDPPVDEPKQQPAARGRRAAPVKELPGALVDAPLPHTLPNGGTNGFAKNGSVSSSGGVRVLHAPVSLHPSS